MKKYKMRRKAISIFLAVLMAVTGILPAATAYADDGVEGFYEIQLFYKETDTMVPTYVDETAEEKQTYIEYMVEGEELELTYKLIGTAMPDNGYIKWYSETPSLVDVTQEGVVKAFDSSKGAIIQYWIDNEVKTVPLIGSVMATVLEKLFYNDYVDIDSMDTEEIVNIVEGAFGSDSPLAQWSDAYKGELVDSLRYYLDNINSNVHVQLFDADGTLLADDYVEIAVTKCEEWYANFLPNGTHITNKSQIDTTVAVGSEVQLYAVTTPLRLHYNCIYSVKSTSIFDQGKVVATVNDSGLVTFKNTGTVTIIVSPDTEEIIQGILELVNHFYALENTGTINTDQIAGILIDYVGLDMNRTVLAGLLDVCFAISDIVGDTADPVQLTATAIEIISNLVLQFVYNDEITFTVIDGQPITDFSIDGVTTVKEGEQLQMRIVDVKPSAGDTTDIVWTSSDPSIASVDEKTGIITGRDAGGSLGSISTQQCVITATSTTNNVSKSVTVTVTGKTGRYLSDVEIVGLSSLDAPAETDYSYQVYPARVAESDNLYIEWGLVSGTDEDGNTTYIWADENTPAENEIGKIDSTGHYWALGGGICEIAIKAYTGYPVTDDYFYEISSFTNTFKVTNGIPVESINISVNDIIKPAGNISKIERTNNVNINGQDYTYVTIKVLGSYTDIGIKTTATVYPETASNKNVRWIIDNGYFETEVSADTLTAEIKQKIAHDVADTFNVYAVSEDGKVKSNVITICNTKSFVNSNVINQDSIELNYGETVSATHSVSFDGSFTTTAYACYKCNWYSSDESVFTVQPQNNDNRDATITAVDVGTATLYCVSADGGIVDSVQVTVYPDKDYLQQIVKLCNTTIVRKTPDNAELYKKYSKQLDLAYYVLYSQPMASQSTCDTYAKELLYAFYNIGGFVGIIGVDILGTNKTPLESEYKSVVVDGLYYTNSSYDFDYKVKPSNAMYSNVTWSSSNDSVKVDQNGKCTPASNDPCSAVITCTVRDYMGSEISSSVYVAFVKEQATGVSLNTTSIVGGKIGESQQLTATVEPSSLIGGASCTDVHWESSDESIATVDQNGVVTFVAGGDCIVYCITNDGGKVAQCSVNVVTNYSNLSLLIQQYTDLQLDSVNYYPDSWNNYTAAMNDAKTMVAEQGYSQKEVDEMYAKLEKAYKSLEKYNYIQKVELYLDGEATSDFYQYDLSLLSEGISYKNAVLDLNVRLYPNNASYESVKWESSTSDITVSSDGKCTPTSNKACYGMITCTVTDHFGNSFSDNVWVSYSYRPVTAIELSQSSIIGVIGETYQLYASVKPDGLLGANIKDYFWMSLDENIATVDETGLVTFKGAGATAVRAVSYDGGIYGECLVSSGGDRTALKAALEQYKDVDYTQYSYDFGMAFKTAYEEAESILTDNTCTQEYINQVTDNLNTAYSNMIANPYINIESIGLNYTSVKKDLLGRETVVATGSVSSSDAVSINLDNGDYSNFNNYNYLKIAPSLSPANAMYNTASWTVDASSGMDTSTDGQTITFTPKNTGDGAYAVATLTYTNHYGVNTSRTICVVMSDDTVKSFAINEDAKEIYATASPVQLNYSISGGEFPTIFWTSSNESVATVDQNGVVTPVEKGTATITAKTLDGGISDTVKVTVITDFSALAAKQTEYYNLIEQVADTYTYTAQSLENLSVAVNEAKIMIDAQSATQKEVNDMLERLNQAYNDLEEYKFATGVSINVDGQENVSVVNEGYIRYEATSIYGKEINLNPTPYPENAVYKTMSFSSSDSTIKVDENGVVKNTSLNPAYATITCTITNEKDETYESKYYVSFTKHGITGVSFNQELVYGSPSTMVTLAPVLENSQNSTSSLLIIKDCTYSSANPEIATVNEKGTVTFISPGETTITATSVDGGYSATIRAYTTWDTTALKAAIDTAQAIDYMDYAYDYGTAFKAAYENALAVYEDIYASQNEIDSACAALTEATNALEGNEFITPEITITSGGELADGTSPIVVNDSNQVVLDYSFNENAMVKSSSWACTCDDLTSYTVNESNQLVITKNADGNASVTVTVTAVDDYDREVSKTVTLSIIDGLINATSIALTANGTAIEGTSYSQTGCGIVYRNLDLTLGYIVTPDNANAVASVSYTSSNSNYVTVDQNGVIAVTSLGKVRTENTATITCTVTNVDGSSVSASVDLTLSIS